MKDERLEFRLPSDLLQRIDEWRERQPIKPSRGAAVRYLVQRSLEEPQRAPSTDIPA